MSSGTRERGQPHHGVETAHDETQAHPSASPRPGGSAWSAQRSARDRQLVAKPAASANDAARRRVSRVKQAIFGRPLANEEEIGERLSKKIALPIFSSDAISSSAYATEEILASSSWRGAAALASRSRSHRDRDPARDRVVLLPPGLHRLPVGRRRLLGRRENLGQLASLVAAAALLIDYILTVAVSTSSAVEQIASAVPGAVRLPVEIALARSR